MEEFENKNYPNWIGRQLVLLHFYQLRCRIVINNQSVRKICNTNYDKHGTQYIYTRTINTRHMPNYTRKNLKNTCDEIYIKKLHQDLNLCSRIIIYCSTRFRLRVSDLIHACSKRMMTTSRAIVKLSQKPRDLPISLRRRVFEFHVIIK